MAAINPEAAGDFFLLHNVQRYLDPLDHEEPIWFFLPGLLLGTLPWSLLLVPLVHWTWRHRSSLWFSRTKRPPAERACGDSALLNPIRAAAPFAVRSSFFCAFLSERLQESRLHSAGLSLVGDLPWFLLFESAMARPALAARSKSYQKMRGRGLYYAAGWSSPIVTRLPSPVWPARPGAAAS